LLSNALWVSSIEQSAMMIAAPFEPAPAGLVASPCPTKAASYEGKFGDSRVASTIRFALENDVCIGEIVLDKLLADFFNAFPQRDAQKLRVIGIDAAVGLLHAALVIPIGIYDFRAQADGSHFARFGQKRALSLTFN
jgi:serine beta-lactamase-like protein LACTB, mitochondrial